jgi:hypothetical protein
VCRWAVLLPRQGGGRTIEAFDDDFFSWLSRQIPAIEDYLYVGIDFSRDPEIPVPPSEERREMGKSPPLYFFCLFVIYIIFFCMPEYLTDTFVVCRCGTHATCRLCME